MLAHLKKIWKGWLKFAEIVGNIQMIVLLSLIYWVMLPIVAIPFRLLADPLSLRHRGQARWITRSTEPQTIESMRKQG